MTFQQLLKCLWVVVFVIVALTIIAAGVPYLIWVGDTSASFFGVRNP